MVQLIVGEKGKGKTKHLLDKANTAVQTATGNIVYVDKNPKHMYELNTKIRLIDASRYPIRTGDQFIGFICGIASQDHDLQQIYLDSFLTLVKVSENATLIKAYIDQLEEISAMTNVDFILSVSKDKEVLHPDLVSKIVVEL